MNPWERAEDEWEWDDGGKRGETEKGKNEGQVGKSERIT